MKKKSKRVLLHSCCGPCAIYPHEVLKNEDTTAFFYNPNIHPLTEYRKRRDAFIEYADSSGLKTIIKDDYDLETFLQGVSFKESDRCKFCYNLRLTEAAKTARDEKFDEFTTTLLVSPYQDQELIRETGENVGQKVGIPFLYLDFRKGYNKAVTISKEMGLYRQKYCGCIYSERDRYSR